MVGMKYDPDTHHRHTVRLQGYDYSQTGAYFVTLCTQGRKCLFGDIVDGQMRLNNAGKIVAGEWMKTAEMRNDIELDEWAIMPNHFHAILVIVRRGDLLVALDLPVTVAQSTARNILRTGRPAGRPYGPPPRSIGAVMAGFKSAVAKRINEWRQTPGVPLWQRNYWEHVIRSEPELNGTREYIRNNPAQWELDTLYNM
jgi:REP element-mobilizing transposase RayT